MADEQPKHSLDFEKLKAALELIDKHPLVLNSRKEKLEAHLVPVEDEDGSIMGEVVELRTKTGRPVLVMNQSDYDACLEWEQSNGN